MSDLRVYRDSFIQVRQAREQREDDNVHRCFICGYKGSDFDRDGDGFEKHWKEEHNAWHYLSLYMYLREKELDKERQNDFSGLETQVKNSTYLAFYPVNRSRTLEMKQRFHMDDDSGGEKHVVCYYG